MKREVLSELKLVSCVFDQYFLDHGSAVAEVDGVVVNSFAAGDFFGEISFVATATSLRGRDPADFKVRRTANVVAREHCRCLELKVQDLFAVFGEDSEGLGALLGCVHAFVRWHPLATCVQCMHLVSTTSSAVLRCLGTEGDRELACAQDACRVRAIADRSGLGPDGETYDQKVGRTGARVQGRQNLERSPRPSRYSRRCAGPRSIGLRSHFAVLCMRAGACACACAGRVRTGDRCSGHRAARFLRVCVHECTLLGCVHSI